MFESLTASKIASGATGGPLYLTKNAAGAPPYSFAGDTNTGVDSDGADSLVLVTGGTTRFTVSTTAITSTLDLTAPNLTATTRLNCVNVFYNNQVVMSAVAAATVGGSYRGVGVGNGNNADEGYIGSAYMFSTAGNFASDTMFKRATGVPGVLLSDIAGTGGVVLEGFEQTAPANAPANGYRIFAVDSGGGKTALKVIFSSGAAQTIATEP